MRIIKSLLIVSTVFNILLFETAVYASKIAFQPVEEVSRRSGSSPTIKNVDKIAREITVQIKTPSSYDGSGVIIAKSGKTYYVLTCYHVAQQGAGEYEIITYDKGYKFYLTDVKDIQKISGADLAIVSFQSSKNYQVAKISKYLPQIYDRRSYETNTSKVSDTREFDGQQMSLFVSGFPMLAAGAESRYTFSPGTLINTIGSTVSNPRDRKEGYRLGYTNLTDVGISGGPILDANGRLVGIHGRADGTPLISKDSDLIVPISSDEQKRWGEFRINFGYSLGIPISSFLVQLPIPKVPLKLQVESSPPQTIPKSDLESWNRTKDRDEENPIVLINIGNQLWRQGNMEGANESFVRAINIAKKNQSSEKGLLSLAYFAKCFVSSLTKDYDDAITNCTESTKITPKFYNPWRYLSGALYRKGEISEALVKINTAIRLNKEQQKDLENPNDYVERGQIQSALGMYPDAIDSFNEAINLDRNFIGAYTNRAFVLTHIPLLKEGKK